MKKELRDLKFPSGVPLEDATYTVVNVGTMLVSPHEQMLGTDFENKLACEDLNDSMHGMERTTLLTKKVTK